MNSIQPQICKADECMVVRDNVLIAERYTALLGDESKLSVEQVASIYFPTSVEEVAWAVNDIRSRSGSCVVSAGRTGIAGGATPLEGSSIISLSELKRPLSLGRDGDDYYIRVEPGMSLASLTGLLMKNDFSRLTSCTENETSEQGSPESQDGKLLWFPVNPTETSAHIGGIVATNASGARSYKYGATREWVRAISVVLPDGRLLKVRRGETFADKGEFQLIAADGSRATIFVPDIELPSTKATLGYPLKSDMDLIDLFIGSEGTLGIIVEVELRLIQKPESTIGVVVIVPDEGVAIQLVEKARNTKAIQFDAIEYFDQAAFTLLHQKKETDGVGSHIPDLPSWDGCGVYFELSGTEGQTEDDCVVLEEILEAVGLSLDDTWAAMEPGEMAAQRVFRHAVPEAVNTIIGQRKKEYPKLHKVGTDMAVSDVHLQEIFSLYRRDLDNAGIESVVFGHIGDNHVHVNLLPKNMKELERAKCMYQSWAESTVAMGGAVAAEHGIGRMKKQMLEKQYSSEVLESMRRVRKTIDAYQLFAPGVLFESTHH